MLSVLNVNQKHSVLRWLGLDIGEHTPCAQNKQSYIQCVQGFLQADKTLPQTDNVHFGSEWPVLSPTS